MSKQKVIYLDYDGVLHPAGIQRHYKTGELSCHDGEPLFRWLPILEALLDGHTVDIVLSTSWVTAFCFDEALSRLPKQVAERVIGATWEDGRNKVSKGLFVRQFRWEQIMADASYRGLSLGQWLAIDDETETILMHLREQFAQCDGRKGISDQSVQNQIQQWL